MTHVYGDLLDAPVDVIVHQTNCKGAMGAGIAKQIAMRYPQTNSIYRGLCWKHKDNSRELLGTCLYTREANYVICNAFGQDGFSRYRIQTEYDMLKKCFEDIANKYAGKKIGLPYKIGCGLAGGDWNVVESMILEILDPVCDVFIYEFNP